MRNKWRAAMGPGVPRTGEDLALDGAAGIFGRGEMGGG